jgi:hypothetical protein
MNTPDDPKFYDLDCNLYMDDLRLRTTLSRGRLEEGNPTECQVCAVHTDKLEVHFFYEPEDGAKPRVDENKAMQDIALVCPDCHRKMTRHIEDDEAVARGFAVFAKYFTNLMEMTGTETTGEAVDAYSRDAVEPNAEATR